MDEHLLAPRLLPSPRSSSTRQPLVEERQSFLAMSSDQEGGASAPDDDFRVAVTADELHCSVLASLDHPQVDP